MVLKRPEVFEQTREALGDWRKSGSGEWPLRNGNLQIAPARPGYPTKLTQNRSEFCDVSVTHETRGLANDETVLEGSICRYRRGTLNNLFRNADPTQELFETRVIADGIEEGHEGQVK